MKPQDTIDFHLRWGWTKLSKLYSAEAERRGIPFSFVFILLHTEKKGTPSTKLGPKMGMESTSLSRILKTLESKRLIKRSPNPDDGRGVLINLTTLGLEKREDSRQRVFMFNNKIKTEIGPEKLNHFFDVSETILQLIHEKKIF